MLSTLLLFFSTRRAQIRGRWITATVILLTLGGTGYFTLTTDSDTCTGGTWEKTGDYVLLDTGENYSEYNCTAQRKPTRYCTRLSSTRKTCYNWLVPAQLPFILDVMDSYNQTVVTKDEVWLTNVTCLFVKGNPANGTPDYYMSCRYLNHTIVTREDIVLSRFVRQELWVNGRAINTTDEHLWCYMHNATTIICKGTLDGDGGLRIPGVNPGMSYNVISKTNGSVLNSQGHQDLKSFETEVKR